MLNHPISPIPLQDQRSHFPQMREVPAAEASGTSTNSRPWGWRAGPHRCLCSAHSNGSQWLVNVGLWRLRPLASVGIRVKVQVRFRACPGVG